MSRSERKECQIVAWSTKHYIGRMADKRKVLLLVTAELADVNRGDTVSFLPDTVVSPNLRQNNFAFIGRDAVIVKRKEKPEPELVCPNTHDCGNGLPEVHARHFDKAGNIKLGPRPWELFQQRKALTQHKTD